MKKQNAIRVNFKGNKKDYWFKNKIKELKKDDKILVQTKNGIAVAIYQESRSLSCFEKGHPTQSSIQKI